MIDIKVVYGHLRRSGTYILPQPWYLKCGSYEKLTDLRHVSWFESNTLLKIQSLANCQLLNGSIIHNKILYGKRKKLHEIKNQWLCKWTIWPRFILLKTLEFNARFQAPQYFAIFRYLCHCWKCLATIFTTVPKFFTSIYWTLFVLVKWIIIKFRFWSRQASLSKILVFKGSL